MTLAPPAGGGATAAAAPLPPPPSFPQQGPAALAAAAALPPGATQVFASSAADLLAAAASPGVTLVTLTAHIALTGAQMLLLGPPVTLNSGGGSTPATPAAPLRNLTVRGDAASCARRGPYATASGVALPLGLCAIDARGLSRHAQARAL